MKERERGKAEETSGTATPKPQPKQTRAQQAKEDDLRERNRLAAQKYRDG